MDQLVPPLPVIFNYQSIDSIDKPAHVLNFVFAALRTVLYRSLLLTELTFTAEVQAYRNLFLS